MTLPLFEPSEGEAVEANGTRVSHLTGASEPQEPAALDVWLSLTEAETRCLATGQLPDAVRERLQTVALDVLNTLDLGPAGWAREK